jgi:hypothetical protein
MKHMTDDEFRKWLFPPAPLSRTRKLVINLIMLIRLTHAPTSAI